jgi:hypothetical protein
MTAFWDIAPCSLEADWYFRNAYCLHHQGDETPVYFNETARRYVPESCHLHTRRRENLIPLTQKCPYLRSPGPLLGLRVETMLCVTHARQHLVTVVAAVIQLILINPCCLRQESPWSLTQGGCDGLEGHHTQVE